jgi:hypothetical protein
MDVADPVAKELARGQLRRVVGRRAEDRQVRLDRREEARGRDGAPGVCEVLKIARGVDEVIIGPLARMVRPGTGLRERGELLVEADEAADLPLGLVVQLLEGDLADDLVAQVTPGPTPARTPGRSQGQPLSRRLRAGYA